MDVVFSFQPAMSDVCSIENAFTEGIFAQTEGIEMLIILCWDQKMLVMSVGPNKR